MRGLYLAPMDVGQLRHGSAARQNRATRFENSIAAAFAACDSRLPEVIHGSEFAARHQNPPFGSMRESIRLYTPSFSAVCARSANRCRSSLCYELISAG